MIVVVGTFIPLLRMLLARTASRAIEAVLLFDSFQQGEKMDKLFDGQPTDPGRHGEALLLIRALRPARLQNFLFHFRQDGIDSLSWILLFLLLNITSCPAPKKC